MQQRVEAGSRTSDLLFRKKKKLNAGWKKIFVKPGVQLLPMGVKSPFTADLHQSFRTLTFTPAGKTFSLMVS